MAKILLETYPNILNITDKNIIPKNILINYDLQLDCPEFWNGYINFENIIIMIKNYIVHAIEENIFDNFSYIIKIASISKKLRLFILNKFPFYELLFIKNINITSQINIIIKFIYKLNMNFKINKDNWYLLLQNILLNFFTSMPVEFKKKNNITILCEQRITYLQNKLLNNNTTTSNINFDVEIFEILTNYLKKNYEKINSKNILHFKFFDIENLFNVDYNIFFDSFKKNLIKDKDQNIIKTNISENQKKILNYKIKKFLTHANIIKMCKYLIESRYPILAILLIISYLNNIHIISEHAEQVLYEIIIYFDEQNKIDYFNKFSFILCMNYKFKIILKSILKKIYNFKYNVNKNKIILSDYIYSFCYIFGDYQNYSNIIFLLKNLNILKNDHILNLNLELFKPKNNNEYFFILTFYFFPEQFLNLILNPCNNTLFYNIDSTLNLIKNSKLNYYYDYDTYTYRYDIIIQKLKKKFNISHIIFNPEEILNFILFHNISLPTFISKKNILHKWINDNEDIVINIFLKLLQNKNLNLINFSNKLIYINKFCPNIITKWKNYLKFFCLKCYLPDNYCVCNQSYSNNKQNNNENNNKNNNDSIVEIEKIKNINLKRKNSSDNLESLKKNKNEKNILTNRSYDDIDLLNIKKSNTKNNLKRKNSFEDLKLLKKIKKN